VAGVYIKHVLHAANLLEAEFAGWPVRFTILASALKCSNSHLWSLPGLPAFAHLCTLVLISKRLLAADPMEGEEGKFARISLSVMVGAGAATVRDREFLGKTISMY